MIPGTPMARQEERGEFQVPDVPVLLKDAIFRTNHASNWLPLEGRLPRDREAILQAIDGALDGRIPLRPDWARGL